MFKTAHAVGITVCSLLALFDCPTAQAEWVEWLIDSRVSGQFDSNINHSLFAAQQRQDGIGKIALSAGRAYQLDDYSRAYITAEWQGESHADYWRLNQHSVGGKAVLAHKFGLGWQAPVLQMDLAGGEIYSESQLRSGGQITAGLQLSSWCNDFLQGFIGYHFDDRNGPNANNPLSNQPNSVFALQGHTVEIGNFIVVNDYWQVNVSYSHRFGDVVSNNLPSSLPASALSKVSEVARDDAFPGWVYRAQGNTHRVNAGVSYALFGGHVATALNYSYIDTQALGLGYQSHQIQLSVNTSY